MDELLRVRRIQRDRMVETINTLRARERSSIGAKHPLMGEIDLTPNWIETLEGRAAELTGLIATFGGRAAREIEN